MIEFSGMVCYIRHRKSTHSKVDAPELVDCPYGHRLICLQTGEAFLFLPTVSLIEKGKKRNNQDASHKNSILFYHSLLAFHVWLFSVCPLY